MVILGKGMDMQQSGVIAIILCVVLGCGSAYGDTTGAPTFDDIYKVAEAVHSTGDYLLRTRYTDYSGIAPNKVKELKRLASEASGRRDIGSTAASVLTIDQFEKKPADGHMKWHWNIRPQKVILFDESTSAETSLEFVFGVFEKEGLWYFSCARPHFPDKPDAAGGK